MKKTLEEADIMILEVQMKAAEEKRAIEEKAALESKNIEGAKIVTEKMLQETQ